MQSEDRLRRLQVSMAQAGVDMAAFGPTANMRYLLGFAPHPDERPCLLLVGQQAVRMVVPSLNAEETAAHTEGIELVAWEDAEGTDDLDDVKEKLEDFIGAVNTLNGRMKQKTVTCFWIKRPFS